MHTKYSPSLGSSTYSIADTLAIKIDSLYTYINYLTRSIDSYND